MNDLVTRSRILVIVSHNVEFLERVCTRALMLDAGEIVIVGQIKEVIDHYRRETQRAK